MTTTAVNPRDVWRGCDIPPLADVNERFPLEKERIPAYLQGAFEQILQAVQSGVRCIVLDARERRSLQEGFNGKSASINATTRAADADIFQLVLRGLQKDNLCRGFGVVTPDDRGDYSLDGYRKFYREIIASEEQGTPPFSGAAKGILVLTPETDTLLGPDRQLFKSKLGRLYPSDVYARISMPKPSGNLYAQWARHAFTAKTDAFQQLLLSAASQPVLPDDGYKRLPRIKEPIPNGIQYRVHKEQERAFTDVLHIMQAQLWCRMQLLIHGAEYGTGKTALLTAQAQLQHQLGFYAEYYHHQPEGSIIANFSSSQRGNFDYMHYFHDQIDRARKFPAECQRRTMTANARPDALSAPFPFKNVQDVLASPPGSYSSLCETAVAVAFPGPPWKDSADI